jgi:hypothetical protein
MRYLATLSDWQEPSDVEWLSGDGESMDWHQAFLDTLANAIESIASGGQIWRLAVGAEGSDDAED